MIQIHNEDCFDTMRKMEDGKINIVLTSPFYNTNKKAGNNRTLGNTKVREGQYDYVRYDSFVDNMTNDEYSDFTRRLFLEFDRILAPNGCILYNINYGAENTDGMFRAVNEIISQTPFTIADVIVWKKASAMPNSCSSNRLTRIWEFVFVFCRRTEMKTFSCNKQEVYCWLMASSVGNVLGRIRNHSIGVLLTDVSGGMELDDAVKRYEKIVAPANYKRPKAIFTKKMLEEAQKTITELGYLDALPRRFATLDDITVNNILFSNRDSAKRIGGSVFDQMMAEAKTSPKQFSRVEEITIEKFLSDVLPSATEIEAYVENRHEANMVSLIASQNPDAKTMFKWANGFSWAYAGNMTDSDIRENVKNAGGRVDGVLRFSIQWNDVDDDANDLDAHCVESFYNEEIYYAHKVSRYTRGNLDVDIIDPRPGHPAVENITFPTKSAMHGGQYRFFVHCFCNRGGKNGFRAEIEFDGKLYRYDYRKPLRHNENVEVAVVTLDEQSNFSIEEKLTSQFTSRDVWNVKTNTFVPVSVVMFSPNYWDEQQGIGHRHYFFMLNGCVNPESPNGFYNEFLKQELVEHKRVFEALGGKMAVADTEDQLSGLGFSSTKRNDLIVKVKGATERVMKIKF